MKEKGNSKNVKKPNFWSKHEKIVPEETKEYVFNQYLDSNTLYVYCDTALFKEKAMMSRACTYVTNGTVIVKNSLIYINRDLIPHNIYGEFKAIQFALNNVENHVINTTRQIVIFSDMVWIEGYMKNDIKIKIKTIDKLRQDLILEYNKLCSKNKNLEIKIEYLPTQFHKHNPFYRSAHNAARKMLEDRK